MYMRKILAIIIMIGALFPLQWCAYHGQAELFYLFSGEVLGNFDELNALLR
jgi:hypothetical protein